VLKKKEEQKKMMKRRKIYCSQQLKNLEILFHKKNIKMATLPKIPESVHSTPIHDSPIND